MAAPGTPQQRAPGTPARAPGTPARGAAAPGTSQQRAQQDLTSKLYAKLGDKAKTIKEKDRLLNSAALTLERTAKRLRSGTEAGKEKMAREAREMAAAHLRQAKAFAEAKLQNERRLENERKLQNEKLEKDLEKLENELKKLAELENEGKPGTVIATTYTPKDQRGSDAATASGSQSNDAETKKKTATKAANSTQGTPEIPKPNGTDQDADDDVQAVFNGLLYSPVEWEE